MPTKKSGGKSAAVKKRTAKKKSAAKKAPTKKQSATITKKPAVKSVAAPLRFELMFQEGRKIFIVVKDGRDNAEMVKRLDKAVFLNTVRSYRQLAKGAKIPAGYELEKRSPSDILSDAKA